jgi:lauroyl/myristoyl acyltransferase
MSNCLRCGKRRGRQRRLLLRETVARLRRMTVRWLRAIAIRLIDVTGAGLARLSPAGRYRLAALCAWPFVRFWLPNRPAVARNFAVVLGRATVDRQARRLARCSVRQFARMAVDFLALRGMTPATVYAMVTVEGAEHLAEARSTGRGAVLALPHFGSWDVAAAAAAVNGFPITVVTEGDWAAGLVDPARASNVSVVARTGSVRPLLRALARNECVAILCDIVPSGVPSVLVPFFGRPARFPLGPARLAQRAGAAVLVVTCTRRPDGTYVLRGLPPLRADTTVPADEGVRRLTEAIAAGFEQAIAAQPEQWYPFRPIWDDAVS